MKNIFQKSSSNWVKYDKYEWRTAANGKCYITPSADAKPSTYNPIKDYEKLVLTAINIGTIAMNKASEAELKDAIMNFVSEYGMLGLMTALPTTPDFITYEAVYLPKNHFIKEESISTEKSSARSATAASRAIATGKPHATKSTTAAPAIGTAVFLVPGLAHKAATFCRVAPQGAGRANTRPPGLRRRQAATWRDTRVSKQRQENRPGGRL